MATTQNRKVKTLTLMTLTNDKGCGRSVHTETGIETDRYMSFHKIPFHKEETLEMWIDNLTSTDGIQKEINFGALIKISQISKDSVRHVSNSKTIQA